VVLSGGGARGIAHVGVLKVLEELQIPIDCIAGTSMGAVVGGLYASGMSAHDIDTTIRSLDWEEAFRDSPPRRELGFRRKQDDRNFLVRLPLGLKHWHILLPKGLVQGQKLQETLRQLTVRYDDRTDFDRLPTPFRAVATDLVTGEGVLLSSGDLALAMRASTSAPGVFAPVEYQGRLLVDGGLAENLPIDVARALHADVLIVSDVSFPLQSKDKLDSAFSISNQTLAILVRRDSDRQRKTLTARDVLIEPALGEATSTDFTAGLNTIVLGERAARAMEAELAPLRVDDDTYRAYLARRAAREPALPTIQFLHVDEQSKRYEKTIVTAMQPLVGHPLNGNQVSARIAEIYGLGNFETLDYNLVELAQPADPRTASPATAGLAPPASAGMAPLPVDSAPPAGSGAAPAASAGPSGSAAPSEPDETGLDIHARRKSWGPNYVRVGLNLDDDFQGNSHYNAAAQFLMTEINGLGAELLTQGQIGYDPKITSEFYQPLDPLHMWFVAPSVRVEARDLPIFVNNGEVADFRDREVEGDFDVGRNLGNWGEIRAGIHRTNGLTYERYGQPDLVESQYNDGEFFFKFTYDRIDNIRFPRDGSLFTLQWDADRTDLGSDFVRDRVSGDWLLAESRGRNTLLLWSSAGITLDGDVNPKALPEFYAPEFYSLGGFFDLSGLAPTSLIGPNYAITRAIYFRKIGRGGEGFLDFPAYVGASLEMGNTWNEHTDVNFGSVRKDASVFFAFDTFLGPLYLGTGYDSHHYAAYYLFLGRTF
jgi:NTE family protein